MPNGPLRVTNSDALLPPLLAGLGIAELPEFIAAEYLKEGRLVHLLDEWSMTQGGLYFVTPTSRSRPLKVKVLSASLQSISASPRGAGQPDARSRNAFYYYNCETRVSALCCAPYPN